MKNLCRRHAVAVVVVFAFLSLRAPAAEAEPIRLISPPSAATAEGQEVVTPARDPLRIQYLIPASDFAGLPASHRTLVAFNFRSDRAQTQAVDWTMPHEQIWLSTTNVSSLTTSFEANHGSNKTLVYDGAITYPFLGTGPANGPRPFADGPRLQTPFIYDPSQGNLVIELRDFDKNYPTPSTIDVVTDTIAAFRVLLNIGNPNGATGVLVPNAVTPFQLEFVPEPTACALTWVALISFIKARPRKLARPAR